MNLVWTPEEMILAGDVAAMRRWRPVNSQTAELRHLSTILRLARYHPEENRPNNFRSVSSVGMKINNLRASHPTHTGLGLRPTPAETEIVNLFLLDERKMREVASELLLRIAGRNERPGDAANLVARAFH